jgi:quercetin dioxygenase-like cupin family protein
VKKLHYKEVPPDLVGEEGAMGLTIRWVISEQDGAPNFSMRVFEVEPGGYSPLHQHPWEHEVFVLKGRGILMEGQTGVPISKGDVIFIPGGEQHQLRNPFGEHLEFICLVPNRELLATEVE